MTAPKKTKKPAAPKASKPRPKAASAKAERSGQPARAESIDVGRIDLVDLLGPTFDRLSKATARAERHVWWLYDHLARADEIQVDVLQVHTVCLKALVALTRAARAREALLVKVIDLEFFKKDPDLGAQAVRLALAEAARDHARAARAKADVQG